MRRLSCAAVLALLIAACQQTGSIEGRITVGPGQEGLAIFAVLWRLDPAPAGSTDGPSMTALGAQSLGVATGGTNTFDYSFYGLAAGTYIVGAWADLGDDREITEDAITADTVAPIEIDPAVAERRTIQRDLFLGVSAPDKGTIRGSVHAPVTIRGGSVRLVALDKPVTDPAARVLSTTSVPVGDAVPFALFNVLPGPVHLFAQLDVGQDGNAANDLFAIHPMNPLSVKAGAETGPVELWIGRQGPDLGSLAGTLSFNAVLPSLAVDLFVLAPLAQSGGAPMLAPDAAVEAIVRIEAGGRAEVPFEIPSLRPGLHYLAAIISTTDPDGTVQQAARFYSINHKEAPIDTNLPTAREIMFPIGLGRCSGRVLLHEAPDSLRSVAIFALVPGADSTPGLAAQPSVYEAKAVSVAPVGGEAAARYQLFGLEDGTYDLALIPDSNGDGSVQEEYEANQIFNGAPLRVTVSGGGRFTSDFDVTFAP